MAKRRGLLLPNGKNITSAKAQGAIKAICRDTLPYYKQQRAEIQRVDAWTKGEQYGLENVDLETQSREGRPFMPRQVINHEVGDLASRSVAPWGRLVVASLSQTIYWESARISGQAEDAELDCWQVLQENRWESRQIPATRATIGHGLSFVKALPGLSPLDGSKSAAVNPVSGMRGFANFDELDDEWPSYYMEIDEEPRNRDTGDESHFVKFIDDGAVHALRYKGTGEDLDDWSYLGVIDIHDLGVTPVVRYANQMDLDGNAMGEIAPIVPLLRAIDQSTFDRFVVQRFGAWKVRYIAGLAEPDTDEQKRAQAMVLRAQDILIAGDADTKFGTLDETPLDGFISARDADLRVLAAVTQTPPHHLLGLSSNLQAEALAAAEAGLQRKAKDFQIYNTGSNQQLLRLIAQIRGKATEAQARKIDIRYRDTESRSLVQAATALTQLATGLHIPVEMLWNRVPGWTDEDSDRARKLIEQGSVEEFFAAAEAANANQAVKETPEQQGSRGAESTE